MAPDFTTEVHGEFCIILLGYTPCIIHGWKAYQVYFHMDPASYPYILGVGRSHRFTTETFSVHGAVSPDFDPMGRVSSGAQ